MRIPSHLNDETLYGRRGRPPQSSQPYRRLIRLCVALALVVVVMQQASEPGVYETFFGADDAPTLGSERTPAESVLRETATDPLAPQVVQPELTALDQRIRSNASAMGGNSIPGEIKTVARTITQSISINEQRQWTVVLDQWQSNENVKVIESMVGAMIDVIQQTEGIDDDQRIAWTQTLRRFGRRHADNDQTYAERSLGVNSGLKTPPTKNDALAANEPQTHGDQVADQMADQYRLTALLNALDQAATDRVVDGAIWRSSDFDAFYRQLDQAAGLSGEDAVAVSVVPLMQQPQTYLGQRVRVAGRVARVQKKEAAANPFGVETYWELWLRPDTGGDRPIVLIAPDVTPAVRVLAGEMNVRRGPEIKVVGRFFKRLAYGSQFGADAAPVVIGRVVGAGQTAIVKSPTTTKRNASALGRSAGTKLLVVLFVASLIGVAIASVVMWRTKTLARRSRQLRQSNRVAPDLSGLNTPSADSVDKPSDSPH